MGTLYSIHTRLECSKYYKSLNSTSFCENLKEKFLRIIKFDQNKIIHQSALFVKSKPSQLYRERTTCTTSMFRVNVTTKTASVTYLFCLVLHLTSKKKYLPTYLYLQVCTRRGFNFQNITPLMSTYTIANQSNTFCSNYSYLTLGNYGPNCPDWNDSVIMFFILNSCYNLICKCLTHMISVPGTIQLHRKGQVRYIGMDLVPIYLYINRLMTCSQIIPFPKKNWSAKIQYTLQYLFYKSNFH